jgi:hypothetical protein
MKTTSNRSIQKYGGVPKVGKRRDIALGMSCVENMYGIPLAKIMALTA